MPPTTLIIIPTGTCIGLNITLANVSDTTSNVAPIITQHGIKYLQSEPINILEICGDIKPTNPIKPHTLTDEAAARIPINAKINLHLSTENPIDFALYSPNNNKFNCFLHKHAKINVKHVYGNNNLTSSHDVPIKLPLVHDMTFCISDKSDAKRNNIPCIAEAMEPIIIPAKTSLIGDVP